LLAASAERNEHDRDSKKTNQFLHIQSSCDLHETPQIAESRAYSNDMVVLFKSKETKIPDMTGTFVLSALRIVSSG